MDCHYRLNSPEERICSKFILKVYRTSDKEVFDEETDYDLYIFDGMLPAKLPDNGSILCINCDKCDMFKSDGEVSGTKITLGDCEVTT